MYLRPAGILLCAMVLLFADGCGDDDGGTNDNNSNQANDNNSNDNQTNSNQTNDNNSNAVDDDTIYEIQDESDPDFIPVGETVLLHGVVVTAVDLYGPNDGDVFVQEPDGGSYSGLLLYGPTVTGGTLADLTIGHVVNVTGVKEEFALTSDTSGRTMTELSGATIEPVEVGTPLDPELIASPQIIMTEPGAEQYEGVLVAVQNVRRTGLDSYGNVLFGGGLLVGNDLMDGAAATSDGTCYSRVTGVIDYFFYYALVSRSSDDFVVAADQGVCDLVSEICDDATDNDGDGFVDCEDIDCLVSGACRENDPTRCDDGKDNDGDGLIDCDDWGCRAHPDVLAAGVCGEETGDVECSDGSDNDADGYADCQDMSCRFNAAVTVCATYMENTAALCADGVDNNSNGHTDCADFGCQDYGFCPNEETDDAQCADGVDNDNDGHIDCADWSCQGSMVVTVCEGNLYTCSDGLDNDGNGHADCDDIACRNCNYNQSSPVCPPCP